MAPKKLRTAKLDLSSAAEPPTKKLRPSNPPIFDLSTSQPRSQPQPQPTKRTDVKGKGKGKATQLPEDGSDDEDDRLWVDKYEPTVEADLAVHKRKVEDVRRWLIEAFDGGKLRKYRRILALTGPAGTAKTTTIRVLARELGFEILEWRNSMSDRGGPGDGLGFGDDSGGGGGEALFDKFQAFLTRASACHNVFSSNTNTDAPGPSQSQPQSQPRPTPTQASNTPMQTQTHPNSHRHIILLEDLPNLLHLPTQARFHTALAALCAPSSPTPAPPPIVLIISDSGLRGEDDTDAWDGRWQRKTLEVLDVRNVLGPELLGGPYVTRIGFNPIAPTLMTKALQALLAAHASPVPRDVLDIIVGSSNGDIRSAVMALQFACVAALPASRAKVKSKKSRAGGGAGGGGGSARAVLEAVTRREQSLVLFHLMGRVLYNKRKNDPPSSHLSTKDAAKEREADAQLADPPRLPEWLAQHERRASRVCVETLVADSPIDASLFGLYIHQNYTQFCEDVDECAGVCEGLSWVDWIGGHHSTPTPHAFPTLALSTLHALPSPVARRSQKVCKPAWFGVRRAEGEACEGVGDVMEWLASEGGGVGGLAPSGWSHATIATELGGWLRAVASQPQPSSHPPRSHRLFSHLPWTSGVGGGGEVLEEDEEGAGEDEEDGNVGVRGRGEEREGGAGWWAEEDDIEDVE
ncbi:P-loop containing nucleoside triphosphate hydrolase protein [Leucogyrophana mollusca]|uniref:P-loop containing nucleoside triphosphate hydrolase protein n=1 Tax=Leucogyrophana mollusca TaxID=85980 RepID=A0ACB8AW45_9AGAM|nr:P-loop containing nucleoside triphosphate hydrolase protein [Leucogyrophana mollusca]